LYYSYKSSFGCWPVALMGIWMTVGDPSCLGQLFKLSSGSRPACLDDDDANDDSILFCWMPPLLLPSWEMLGWNLIEQCGRSEVWYWAVIRLPDERTQRRGPRNSNKRSPFISPQSPCNWPPKLSRPFCQCTKQFNELDSSISAAIHIFCCWPFVRQYIASLSPAIVLLLSFSLSHINWASAR
jgi:hypothetical protein